MPDHFTLLLEWRRAEATGRILSKLPVDYFAATTQYLAELRRSYEADLRENPSARKGEISRQTYQRASQVARDILEGRMQKILTVAFQASIGGPREMPNALPEERAMFDQLLAVLLNHRRSSAPYLESGSAPSGAPAPPTAHGPTRPTAPPATESAPRTPAPVASPAAPAFTYVRVVREARPVEVGPETVDLKVDDVLSLPPETAKLLIEAKVAEKVEASPMRPVK